MVEMLQEQWLNVGPRVAANLVQSVTRRLQVIIKAHLLHLNTFV